MEDIRNHEGMLGCHGHEWYQEEWRMMKRMSADKEEERRTSRGAGICEDN